MQVNKMINT